MRLIKVDDSSNVKEISFTNMKEAEVIALRDHSMGRDENDDNEDDECDDGKTNTEVNEHETMSSQFINVQRVPDVVNATKNFLNSSLLSSGELLVDINADLLNSGGTIPLEKYIPHHYDDELLQDDLTEDDKRLAAALVAVQLVNQHKQQNTGTHILPMLAPSPTNSKENSTNVNKATTSSEASLNKNNAANIATIVSNYIQAVEEDNGGNVDHTLQPLPPLKKVLSRNKYMRPHLTQLSIEDHQAHLASLGIHTESDTMDIAPEEIEIEQTDVIKSEINDYVMEDVSPIKTEEVSSLQFLLEDDEEQDTDNETHDSDYDNCIDNQQSRKSLPHKKRIPRKLKHPKKNHQSGTSSKIFKCLLCNETFSSSTALLDHRVNHIIKNNAVQVLQSSSFSCELCFKNFTNQWKFFEHLKLHYEPIEIDGNRKSGGVSSNKYGGDSGDSKKDVKGRTKGQSSSAGTSTSGPLNNNTSYLHQLLTNPSTQSIVNRWISTPHLQDVTITPSTTTTSTIQTTTTTTQTGDVVQTVWECQPCKRIFRRQKTYETHMSVAHPKEEDIEEFSDPEDMMAGIKVQVQSDEEKDQSDRELGKEWYRDEDVRAAEDDLQQLEEDKTLNLCEICNQVYDNKHDLNQHISSQHADIMTAITKTVKRNPESTSKPNRLYCKQCDKSFHHRNSLMYHLKSHLGDRPHQCDVCGKGFFATNALKVHMRQHSGVKPYKCEFCGRNFRQWGDLKYHCISIHSDERNFQCEYCGKDFARKYSLTVHSRIHTGERNYKCEFCDKSFRASTYLQNHRRIHTGEKPHPCEICGKPFRVRSDMKRHMMTHSKEPYTSYYKPKSEPPGTPSSNSGDTKLVVQVPDHAVTDLDKVVDIEVTTVDSMLPDETAAASTRLQEELTYTSRDPLDTSKEANTVYVWPIYM